jgi:enterochelin esterase-like enzyme
MTNRWMPHAPPFTPRGQKPPPAPTPVPEEVQQAARPRVKAITVPSRALGRDVSVNLLLPRDYASAAASGRRYPVLYLLHGAFGAFGDWNARSGIAAYSENLPLIVVMPDAGNSFYVNAPGLGRYADFFLSELVPWVDGNYRTLARREGRAIAGLSMGGYGAWRLALDSPQTFACAASLSGVLLWGEGPFDAGLTRTLGLALYGGEGAEQRKLYEADRLTPLLDKNIGAGGAWNGPALYFDIGTEDPLLPGNRILEQRLLERRIPYLYAEYGGKHDWAYWDEHVRDALQFVLRHLPAAAPEATPTL